VQKEKHEKKESVKKDKETKLKIEIPITEEGRKEQDKEKAKRVEENMTELGKINNQLEEKRKELEELKKEIKKKEVEAKQPGKKAAKPKKKVEKKQDETFLNEIKEILARRSIELLNVEFFDKKEVFARIKTNGAEQLLAAYNRKKLDDSDILKAYKRAMSLGLSYYVISKGETSKKTKEAIEAYKKLAAIENIGSPLNIGENSQAVKTPEQ